MRGVEGRLRRAIREGETLIFPLVRRPILRPLGEAWKEVREQVKATQAEVAEALQLSGGQSAISQRERGKIEMFAVRELVEFEDHYGLQRGTVLRRAGYVVDAGTPAEIVDSWEFLSPEARQMIRSWVQAAWEQQSTPPPRQGQARSG